MRSKEAILEDAETAEQMGESGSAAVRERWNWDTEAEELIDFVDALLVGKP